MKMANDKDNQKKPVTYADSGVNVERGEEVVKNIEGLIKSTWNDKIIPDVAGFKGVYDLGDSYLIGATDGIGTKILVGIMAGKIGTLGQDLDGMVVNDFLRVGARPLFFLDYMATGMLETQDHYDIVKGIVDGCRIAGIPLIGGETAELPGMYEKGHFDLAGFAVAQVKKDAIIDGKQIKKGAHALGLESAGIHSNGYSLARKVFFGILNHKLDDYVPELGTTVGEELLRPTKIYVKEILDVLDNFSGQVQGLAHITGGGMPNKAYRSLPEGLGLVVQEGSWPVLPVFQYMEKNGPVAREEMNKTFNRGIGYIMYINDEGALKEVQQHLKEEFGVKSYDIGIVQEGEKVIYNPA